MELTEKEKELIQAIRIYKKLVQENRLFKDYVLYLRGYIEEVLEDE